MPQLLDFSAALIDPEDIRAAGYVGVIGYVSPSRPGANFGAKPLTREYCNSLRAFGLEIVSVWQYGKPGSLTPSDWTTGYPGGVRMATEAAEQHKASGGPGRAPIYFAVDENITLEQWNTTAFEFFRGVNSVLGVARTGIYGHSRVCAWAAQDGVIGEAGGGRYWAWQTRAWSAGEMAPEAVLYQREIDKRAVGGVGVDVNDVLAPRYGQWSSFTLGGPTVTAPAFTEINRVGDSGDSRHGTRITNFLLHTQEGDGTAESLAAYLNNPGNGASYHYVVRDGIVVDVVDTDDASWSVGDANAQTINLCFAGSRASWSRAEWMTLRDDIRIAAWLAVQDAKRYGFSTEVIAPPYGAEREGISDHRYVTEVIGWGTHTDVGPGFPWDIFANDVAQFVTPTGDNDMTPEQEAALLDIQTQLRGPNLEGWAQLGQNDQGQNLTLVDAIAKVLANQSALSAKLDTLSPNKEK